MPTGYITAARAHMVDRMVSLLGCGVLLTDIMWDLYNQLPRWIFTNGCPRKLKRPDETVPDFHTSHLQAFLDAVQEWPVLPQIRQQLHLLSVEHESYLLLISGATPSTSASSDWAQADKDHGVLGSSSTSAQHSHSSVSSPTTREVSRHTGTLNASAPDSSTLRFPQRVLRRLLEDAMVVADAIQRGDSTMRLNSLQQQMRDKADFLLPVRELAPSRKVMVDGFDANFAKTRAGLFSFLIFRCISWNSEVFLSCPDHLRKLQFRSSQDWNVYFEGLKDHFGPRPDDFFCNTRAFGQPVDVRRASNYSTFWDTSMACRWPEPHEFPLQFGDLLILVQKAKHEYGIPGCGNLCSYMLVVDMRMHGLCHAPTVDEVGSRIVKVKAGGLKGLRQLKYLDSDYSSSTAIEDAFRQFYVDASNSLSDQQKVALHWGPVTAEHLLCKLSRMWKTIASMLG
ncbi:hypothetical protein BDW22DRAFT_1433756 [Trametopsis cervina]|nr:hypothetical protein BDW22DRAFT_1433756 [Trametopsis cervina]